MSGPIPPNAGAPIGHPLKNRKKPEDNIDRRLAEVRARIDVEMQRAKKLTEQMAVAVHTFRGTWGASDMPITAIQPPKKQEEQR